MRDPFPRLLSPALKIGGWAYYRSHEVEGLPEETEDRFGNVYRVREPAQGLWRVPRALATVGSETQDLRSHGARIRIQGCVPARNAEQVRLAQWMARKFRSRTEQDGFIVSAPTAFGKTWLGCAAIHALQRHTLVIVPNSLLLKQWRERLQQYLGLKDEEIGHWQGPKCKVEGTKVVLAMLQTVARRRKAPPGYRQVPGLVIFDETHRLAADSFVLAAPAFPARWRIGLSATPQRTDHREKLFQAHLGPVVQAYSQRVKGFRVIQIPTGWHVPDSIPQAMGEIAILLRVMTRRPQRNAQIAEWIDYCHHRGRYIFVFSDRIEHLRMLHAATKIPADEKALFHGRMPKAHYEATRDRQVLFTTYQFLGTGLDFPHFDTAIFTTPLAHIKQPLGRILREHEGKKRPLVLDFVDHSSPVLDIYAASRAREYLQEGGEVVGEQLQG